MTIDVMMRDIRVIPLDKIKLDQENVRFGNDVAESQREAIKLMLSDPDDAKKILRLAEHIVQYGLDPTELQLVTPDEDGNFIVLEGNRRLTALKLLQRPDLCPTDRNYKGFLKAHNNLPNGVPENLQCSVVPTRASGDVWIELKHTGENKGAGRVDWNSDIRDERRARTTGIESIGRQFRNLVIDNPRYFSAKAALDCKEVDVTTLTRLLSSTTGQTTFRLKVENRTLTPQLPLEHIAPSVEFMLDMFVSHGYNVNDVRAEPDRIRTLKHIPLEILPHNLADAARIKDNPVKPDSNKGEDTGENGTNNPNQTNETNPANTGDSNPDNNGTNYGTNGNAGNGSHNPTGPQIQQNPQPGGKANANPELPKDPGIRAKPQSRARKYLIPWSLNISNSRINAIYRELRTVLKVDECPNATAITFRVFMETTCDDYIQLQKDAGNSIKRWDTGQEVRGGGSGDKLSHKIQSVVKHLEGEKLLATAAAKAIIKRATSYDQTGSVDHFNLFVHGTHSLPLPSELKDIAEEYRPLMEAIWR
jgi:hypothetical protein